LTAEQWAQRMREPLRDKSYQLTRLGPAVTEFLAWKRLDGAAERTLDQYERDLSRACVLYPDRTIETLTSADLVHVVASFPQRSQKRARAAFASMYRWAVLWEKVDRNPLDRVPRPIQPPGRYVEVFTGAEVAALTSLDLRDAALMAVLFDAGLRKAEARHLQQRHCLLEQRQLVVVGGKGGKDRVVPMTGRLAGLLADLALTDGLDPDDYVWYSLRGNQRNKTVLHAKAIGEGTFHRWWARCIEAAEVAYRKPHTTRHTFATHWLKQGGRMETLSRVMGHTSIATTVDLYGHLDLSDVARDLALVESRGINPLQGMEQ
jgi:integrase/recombinase XerD